MKKSPTISPSILTTLALRELEKLFGTSVTCTIIYYLGRALGNAIYTVFSKYGFTYETVVSVFETLSNIGIISGFRIHEEDGEIINVLLLGSPSKFKCESAAAHPVLKGIIEVLMENDVPCIAYEKENGIQIIITER